MIRFQVTDESGQTRQVERIEKTFYVGSAPDSGISVQSPHVEWRHGQFLLREGKVFYRDLNSAAGTRLTNGNDERILKDSIHEVELRPGDSLKLDTYRVEMVAVEEDPFTLDDSTQTVVEGKSSADVEGLVKKLEKDHQVLELIYRFEQKLSNVFKYDEILDTIGQAVFEVFEKATHLFVLLLEGEQIRIVLNRRRAGLEEVDEKTKVSRFLVEQVMRTGEALSFSLTEHGGLQIRQESLREIDPTSSVRLNRIQSGLVAPLWSGENVIGVIEVDSRREVQAFTDRDRDLLVLFANRAAMSIEKHRRYQQSLQEARDAAIGQVVNKVVHDLVNHFAVLRPVGEMMENSVRDLERFSAGGPMDEREIVKTIADMRDYWHKISLHQEMIYDLLDDFRHFARDRRPQYSLVPIYRIFEESVEMARFRAVERHKDISFRILGDPAKLALLADVNGVRRVLQNLLHNAVDSIRSKQQGVVTILGEIVKTHGNRYLRVSVCDNGCGIPDDLIGKIFEYGFSTKEGISGSGFGLAVIKKVISEHRGFIRIGSRRDAGTTVRVYLPFLQNDALVERYPKKEENLVEVEEWKPTETGEPADR